MACYIICRRVARRSIGSRLYLATWTGGPRDNVTVVKFGLTLRKEGEAALQWQTCVGFGQFTSTSAGFLVITSICGSFRHVFIWDHHQPNFTLTFAYPGSTCK